MRRLRRLVVGVAAVVLCVAGAALALPQQQGSVDLLNQSDGQWDGPGEAQGGSSTGASVVGLGDVFRRRRAAVAIGAPEANPGGRVGAGSVYVVAGQSGTGAVDLTALSGRGYRIDGGSAGGQLGFSLASVTLGNGHPGLAIGAPYASPAERSGAGLVYVVDLTRLRSDVDLSASRLPPAVVGVFSGPGPCAEAGYAVAAGPLAGRGTSLVVGAPGFDPSGCPVSKPGGPVGGNVGAAYLVAPGSLTRRLDLRSPGSAASTFVGVASGDRTGAAVAGVPGTNQFMVGAPYASPLGRTGAGAVYLLRSPGAGRVISLASPRAGNTTFDGAVANDAAGFALTSTTGFIRGQGGRRTRDLVLGAPQGSPKGVSQSGAVYVLPDSRLPATVDLLTRHVAVIGPAAGDEAGYSLAGLGSVNGRGVPSLAVGAPFVNSATGQDRIDNGAAYVLFGGAGSSAIVLSHLGHRGFVALGARNSDEAGSAVAGVVGENGDGRPGVLIGAPFAESAFGSSPVVGGAVYAVFGWGAPVLHYRRSVLRARVGHRLAPLVPSVQRTGSARFAVSPSLPAGLKLGRSNGWITGTPRRASSTTRYTVAMDDSAGVASAVIIITVSASKKH